MSELVIRSPFPSNPGPAHSTYPSQDDTHPVTEKESSDIRLLSAKFRDPSSQVGWGVGGGCLAAEAANPAEGKIWWQNPPKAGVLRILVTDPVRKQRESAGIWWQPSYNYAQPDNSNVIFGMCSHFGAGILSRAYYVSAVSIHFLKSEQYR